MCDAHPEGYHCVGEIILVNVKRLVRGGQEWEFNLCAAAIDVDRQHGLIVEPAVDSESVESKPRAV